MPPKLAVVLVAGQVLAAVGWILLALDGEIVAWKRWLLGAAAALFLLQAAYYAALVVHRRRR
jgi:hypothetical protein